MEGGNRGASVSKDNIQGGAPSLISSAEEDSFEIEDDSLVSKNGPLHTQATQAVTPDSTSAKTARNVAFDETGSDPPPPQNEHSRFPHDDYDLFSHQLDGNGNEEVEICFSEEHVPDGEAEVKENDEHADGEPNDNNDILNDSNALQKPDTLHEQFQNFRMAVGLWINQQHIQMIVIVLILINALLMGIATFDVVSEDETRNHRFEVTDEAFLVLFTIEVGIQVLYHGSELFNDGWLLFDLIVIVLSWSFSSLQVVRTFRIVRAFRLISRLENLRNLVQAIFDVLPSLFAILWLLLVVIYIYAVLCTHLFADLYERGITEDNYFGRLDITIFYLFQMMTLEWAEITREVMVEYPWAQLVFVSFICISAFILYSLIIAVICDAVAVIERQDDVDKEAEQKEQTRKHIEHLEQRLHAMTKQQLELYRALEIALAQVESEAPDDDDNNYDSNNRGQQLPSVSTLGFEQSQRSLTIGDLVAAESPRGRAPIEPTSNSKHNSSRSIVRTDTEVSV